MSASLQLVPGHFSQANPIVHSRTVLGKARKAFPALRFVPVENMARSPDETQITPSQLEMGRSVRRDQNFAYRLGQDRKRNFQSGDAARTATGDRVTIDGGIKNKSFQHLGPGLCSWELWFLFHLDRLQMKLKRLCQATFNES